MTNTRVQKAGEQKTMKMQEDKQDLKNKTKGKG